MAADAVLLGAVGAPEFDNNPPNMRPERGLLGIRKALEVFANLRPVKMWPSLVDSSPLKNEIVDRHRHDHRARAHRRPLLR